MIGIVLGVIGIVLTMGFGIYSIWSYRKNRKKISLEFKKMQCYSLFKNDVARLNIEIKYNNEVLSNALILLKARIINNGHTDIDKNRVFRPLKLKSTNEFIWLDAKSIIEPNGSTTRIQIINENEIQIEWDLLKSEEFIEFEAIIKVSDTLSTDLEETSVFFSGITFDYRITELNNIQKEKEKDKRTQKKYVSITMAIFTMILGVFMLSADFFPNFSLVTIKRNIDYIVLSDSIKTTTNIIAKNDDEILLSSIKNHKDKTVSVNDFNKNYKIDSIEKISHSSSDLWFIRIMGITYIVMGCLLLFTTIYMERKRKNKLINAST